jgi:hypothetical protein
MLFLIVEDVLKERTRGVVPDFGGDLDGFVQVLDRMHLQRDMRSPRSG